ncbi:hypothetical protein B0H21DRAFT_399247 [Amylocystis lapponica]|nr:hypothetical protein B0H21DRAFT_399247 [Amylocystis lapponica]
MTQPDTHLPWDCVRAETLRALLRDLGLPWMDTRKEMTTRLQAVERDGLDAVVGRQREAKRGEGEERVRGATRALGGPATRVAKGAAAKKGVARDGRASGACGSREVFVGVVLPLVKDLKRPRSDRANTKRTAESSDDEPLEAQGRAAKRRGKQSRSLRASSALESASYVTAYGWTDDE